MRPEDKPENEHHLLQRSWEVQVNTNFEDLPLQLADVDGECIRALERRMFEQSEAAGLAGFYQWGLDAGDHQNAWDPYANIPHDWNAGDLYPEDMDELLVVRIHQTMNTHCLGSDLNNSVGRTTSPLPLRRSTRKSTSLKSLPKKTAQKLAHSSVGKLCSQKTQTIVRTNKTHIFPII